MKTVRNITLVSLLAAGVVSIPAYAHNWVDSSAVKGTITFTEPNQHGFDFAAASTAPAASSNFVHFVGAKEKLDWALGLEHRLVDTPWTRIFLDYDHYETDESSRFDTAAGGQRDLLNLGAAVTGAFGEYDIDADSVKLGMRHRVNHSKRSIIDLGAALSWIDVDRDFTATQSTAAGVSRSLIQEADFEGFGPFFDVTVKHYPRSRNRTGLNIQAYAGAGLLYSETKFVSKVADEVFDREKVKGVSAEMITKLAIGWDYRFCNKSTLSTSLGYMMMHYTDAFEYGATGGAYARFAQAGLVSAAGAGAGAGNSSGGIPFTRQGPYLEFKWSGANF